MLTRDALASLSESLKERRVLSLYLGGQVSDPAARRAWRTVLTANLAALRRTLDQSSPSELAEFDRCNGLLWRFLEPINGALHTEGYAAFVTTDGTALAEKLPVAMPNVVKWTNGPWVSPYVHALKELRPVILAVVDARSARLYRYALGVLAPLQRLHAHTHIDQPSHMGAAPRQSFHTGTRGSTASEAAERSRSEGTQQMLRTVVEQLVQLASTDAWIVVGGMSTTVALVLALLPPRLRERAALTMGLSQNSSSTTLRRAAAAGARQLRRALDDRVVERVVGEAAHYGRGTVGNNETLVALRDNAVHTLLFSIRFLSEQAEACEEMTRLALAGGASVEVVAGHAADQLHGVGGVAGTLRYVIDSALPGARPRDDSLGMVDVSS